MLKVYLLLKDFLVLVASDLTFRIRICWQVAVGVGK